MRSPSAGIIVIKMFGSVPRVLCLEKDTGDYDITKGIMDPGESPIQTALRETEEESGITDLVFKWGIDSVSYGAGTAFVALTSEEPRIEKNPITGKLEHLAAHWVEFDEAIDRVERFLVPALEWAREKVEKNVDF